MKAETQSLNLRKLMDNQKLYPKYDLALNSVCVKKKSIENLEVGSLLLLGMDYLHMVLVQNQEVCATVKLVNVGDCSKIEIISLAESTVSKCDSKKYDKVLCSLGKVHCRKIQLGHRVGISSIGIGEIEIFINNTIYAKGLLVSVDDEIAVEITEVNDG